jgi:hypothetical protein
MNAYSRWRKTVWASAAAVALVPSAGRGQLEELVSPHVRVLKPVGHFAQRLIKLVPPQAGRAGAAWKQQAVDGDALRLRLPPGADVSPTSSGSRVLLAILPGGDAKLRPTLRVDAFDPGPEDPTEVDAEYAQDFVAQYPERAFAGKFAVGDSGMVVLPKGHVFAMIGGSYSAEKARAYRLQWSYLGKSRQYFVTFDCAEREWEGYEDLLARILLSLELPRPRKQ